MTQTPIIPKRINGHPCILSGAATINAALNGTAPLTITHGHATGEQVWLAPRTDQIWADDAIRLETSHIAETVHHPQYGEILAAYADTTRLGPIMARIEHDHAAAAAAADGAAEARIAATLPSCHHCGDCPECC